MKRVLDRIFPRLASIYDATLRIAGLATGVAIWCGAFLIFTEVVARYVFNYGIVFAVEYTCYLTGFVCFVGAAYTQWRRRHITIDLVVVRLPERVQRWSEVITLVISFAVCLVFLYWFTVMVNVSFELGTRAIAATRIPMVIPQSPTVIGFLLLGIVILVQLGAAIKRLRRAQVEADRKS